jgi:Txe/YoeB family toxin of toxin-antitoxin system
MSLGRTSPGGSRPIRELRDGRWRSWKAVIRDPFGGLGKPEPLKHLGPNVWSRRLTAEHRTVYLVRDDRIDFLQGRYHY